jgi:hypothetical protein
MNRATLSHRVKRLPFLSFYLTSITAARDLHVQPRAIASGVSGNGVRSFNIIRGLSLVITSSQDSFSAHFWVSRLFYSISDAINGSYRLALSQAGLSWRVRFHVRKMTVF